MSLRGLLPLLTNRPEFRRLYERLNNQSDIPVLSGVVEAAKPYVVAALAVSFDRPVLYVVRDAGDVERVTETLSGLIGRDIPILPYADRDALPYERLMPDSLSVQSRMNVLTALTRPAGAMIVICSVRALSQPVMPPQEFSEAIVELRSGSSLEPRILLQHLLSLGYEQVAEVETPGQVSHRGGIIDVFPPAMVRPVRVEFFGEEIDSIRTFDHTTQRSLNPIDAVLVGPAREALALRGPAAARQLEALDTVGMHPDVFLRWQRDLEYLRNSQSFDDIAFYLPYLHQPTSPLAYLPARSVLAIYDTEGTPRIIRDLADQGEEVRDRLERDCENPPGLRSNFISWPTLAQELARHTQLGFASLFEDEMSDAAEHSYGLVPDLGGAQSYGGRVRAFAQDVRKLVSERQRVVIVSGQARRLAEIFGDEAMLGNGGVIYVSPATDLPDVPDPGTLSLIHGRFPEGWHSHSLALTVFTDTEIFGWSKRRGDQRRASVTPASFLAELRPGDHIVHQDHGIGRFEGLVKLNTGGVERE
ncbi:MAG: CarD family transcriptional regulator, partial [Ktedonobacterales bacterium]